MERFWLYLILWSSSRYHGQRDILCPFVIRKLVIQNFQIRIMVSFTLRIWSGQYIGDAWLSNCQNVCLLLTSDATSFTLIQDFKCSIWLVRVWYTSLKIYILIWFICFSMHCQISHSFFFFREKNSTILTIVYDYK